MPEHAMPIQPAQPQFPATESLRRFFGTDPRVPVPLAELASLHSRKLDDYIADLLHAAIEPATLAAFRRPFLPARIPLPDPGLS